MFDETTKEKIRDLKILDVADRLQLSYSSRGTWRKALCFCHADHTPSLGINTVSNTWQCFVCGKGGSHIDLVMEHEHLSFLDACKWLIREFDIIVPHSGDYYTRSIRLNTDQNKKTSMSSIQTTNKSPSMGDSEALPQFLDNTLLESFKGASNEFTRAIVQNGILSQAQMQHAADVFHLSTVDDNVIFWQIDRDNNIREGKVMYYQADAHRSHSRKPVTVSWLLKKHGKLDKEWKGRSCLFGLHQLHDVKDADDCIVAIVESEKTAIICSELIPSLTTPKEALPLKGEAGGEASLWLATGGKSNLSPQALHSVQGHRVILFPDTDTNGSTYSDWLSIAKQVNDANKAADGQHGTPISVSNILELHATEDQKKRKIDIADFIVEATRA